jgi:hypothetical protein
LSPTFIDAEWIRAALLGDGVMALLGPLLPQAASTRAKTAGTMPM